MTLEADQKDASHEFKLVGGDDRKSVPVTDSIKVGRDATCELCIPSGKVSRVHAIVSVDADALWVEDQKSTNGTFVNGERVLSKTRLNNGDRVRFNDQVFLVVAPEPEPEPPAAGDATIVAGGDATIIGEAATMLDVPAVDSPQPAAKPQADAPKPAAKPPADPPKPRSDKAPLPVPSSAEPGAGAIPASWADSDQLERSSETAFIVRKPAGASAAGGGDDPKAPKLDPAEAIREARRTVPAEVAILVGLTKPLRGRPIVLGLPSDTKKWEMGRGQSEDIQLDHESVSGRHAQLIHELGRWKIVNLMSVNGTFVNERKVLSAFLAPGDCIRMGEVELAFDARVDSAKAPKADAPQTGERTGGLLAWLKGLFGRHQD